MKKKKITIDDVFEAVNNGFTSIEKRIATKEDLKASELRLETKIETSERKLEKKIEEIKDVVDYAEEHEISDLQRRMMKAERDISILNKRSTAHK